MIVVIHFGGQYTQLIRRRVSEGGVQVEVINSTDLPRQPPVGVTGVILSGSPASVDETAAAVVRDVIAWNVPVLGICFGHQALVHCTGGVVKQSFGREYGKARFCLAMPSVLTQSLPAQSVVWVSHGDTVASLPADVWNVIGTTGDGHYAAIEDRSGRLYGVQFHPEVTHTECGAQILRNFAQHICHAPVDPSVHELGATLVHAVQQRVTDGHLMVACSLGVDSTTVAALCTNALGVERVHPIFVDTGLQREEDLELAHRAHTFLPQLQVIDTRDAFIAALAGQTDPEVKRRLVGQMFWRTFTAVAQQLRERFPIVAYSQGTIAPDVIESGAENRGAAVIKTHHNLVQPPADFPFVPYEPIRLLYKDQVRALGRTMGVPDEILTRHPFPGPGLAVRVKGLVTRERIEVARQCDTIFTRRLREEGLYDTISQAGATVLQDTSVCVRGDARLTGWIVGLWAVTTEDFMTADVAPLLVPFLADVGDLLTNQVGGVGSVVYKVTRKPPATIEWE